jgi:hypothetical protein
MRFCARLAKYLSQRKMFRTEVTRKFENIRFIVRYILRTVFDISNRDFCAMSSQIQNCWD